TFVVQVANATPGANYYFKVTSDVGAAGAALTGNYLLSVNFRATPIPLPQLASQTLAAGNAAQAEALTINQSQVTHFVLSGSASAATAATAVRATVFDQNRQVVFSLTALNGQTISGDVFLGVGNYTIVFMAATVDGSAL